MPFFEFDAGRLVPAQFGRPVAESIDPELLQAVRDQVLDLVQQPLFPVTWHGDPARAGEAAVPRLTAMDPSGQVVTVEVVDRLDPVALVAALGLCARNSELGWTELGGLYPRGVGTFRRDWNVFRESMPPRPAPGPRLIIVAGSVADEVRPALDSLVGSGVSVYEIAVRQLTSGRRFLEVTEVRPRQLGQVPAALTGSPRATPLELSVSPAPTTDVAAPPTEPVPIIPVPQATGAPTSPEGDVWAPVGPPAAAQPVSPVHPVAANGAAPAEPSTASPAASASPAAPPAVPDPAPAVPADAPAVHGGAEAEQEAAPYRSDAGDGVVSDDAADLALIAETLGGDTALTWVQLRRGVRHEATLTSDGLVRLAGGAAFDDPDLAAAAASGRDDVDGWRVWRFGDEGPSLAEALTELESAAARAAGGTRRRHGA
ncbi:hypothetical protein [Georgenia yuyongxinii]|uniref:RAMA domain-containing protein n=1 Tax=Georgenia yuyongxinii TaxID=2589797 RepID=A0A552WKE0_9MICO|nr:hypothetical protein [Georgenia yuyongxinii]TRW43139.1 hypothetical protein FJ693_18845 [Georgenia yuyongxinii]